MYALINELYGTENIYGRLIKIVDWPPPARCRGQG